jgi:hypothetical protein
MQWLDALVLFYGILLIVMAVIGFLKGSVISLIVGGVCGALEIGFAALAKSNPRVGRIGSAVISLLILGQFLPAYFAKHLTTALILWVSSLIVFVCLLGGHLYAMRLRKAARA